MPKFGHLLLLLSLSAMSASAQAAMQGQLGTTSSGSVELSVTKVAFARITGLRDMSLSWNMVTGQDITWTGDVCVYATNALGRYRVKAIGSTQQAGAFVMADGIRQLPYHVTWNDGGAGNLSNEGIALQPNTPSTFLTRAATDSPVCQGSSSGPTARLIIHIAKESLQKADIGNYRETLTLVISPS